MILDRPEHPPPNVTGIVDARLFSKHYIFPQIMRNVESLPGSVETFLAIIRTDGILVG